MSLKYAMLIRRIFKIPPKTIIPLLIRGRSISQIANLTNATLGLTKRDYEIWISANMLREKEISLIKDGIKNFRYQPRISIVMPVYNVDERWLEKAIQSVLDQVYENWELCIADDASSKTYIIKFLKTYSDKDPRIKVDFLKEHKDIAIASNAAASMATGEFLGFLNPGDELSIDALYECVKVLNNDPDVGLIYSDEDKIDIMGKRIDPFFKPDYSPDLLMSQNYIGHFFVINRSLFETIGGFREGFEGSQDHDLVLRVTKETDKIHHIPKILYHWRKIPESTVADDSKSYAWESGQRAIEDFIDKKGIKGRTFKGKFQGCYRVKRKLLEKPLVSIIIPFKDKSKLLKQCVESIIERSTYEEFEIIGVSNNSIESQTRVVMDYYKKIDSRINFLEFDVPFNYSKINNYAHEHAKGKHLILLNNDIEILTRDWIESLLEHSQRPEVGAVGGKLYYTDGNQIQHAGIIIGLFGNAGISHKLFYKEDMGYYAKPHVIHNVSAVTGACLMVKTKLYKKVRGLNENHLGIAYNDVDFCLKLREAGFLNIFTPYCEALHHESASRGYEDTTGKLKRFKKERSHFEKRWKDMLDAGDPYYNPNLTLDSENYALRL